MTALDSVLRAVAADLDAAGAACALIGGLAVSVRTAPRFTRDADLAVAVKDDHEAERLVRHLRGHGYEVDAMLEQDATGRLASVRLGQTTAALGPVVDLLFASSGIEHEVVAAAEPLELLPGFVMAVARTGHLIALKILSRDDITRPQDLVDLRALLRTATASELARAREAVALIASRRCHRGRDLIGGLDDLLSGRP